MKLMKKRTSLYLSKVQKVDGNGLKKASKLSALFLSSQSRMFSHWLHFKPRLVATGSCLDISKPSKTVQLERKNVREIHPRVGAPSCYKLNPQNSIILGLVGMDGFVNMKGA